MHEALLLQELRSSRLMIHSSGYETLSLIANSIISGTYKVDRKDNLISSHFGDIYFEEDENGNPVNPFDNWKSGSIAVIPLTGIMFKYGYWWKYGVDDIADIIRMAYQSEKISSVLIKADTPGGAADSLYVIEDILKNKLKPTYMLTDGMLCSCGYIAGSFCDKIYALNKMCKVGSIGVFARLVFYKNDEKSGYQIKDVYPDASSFKNLPEREAAEDNDQLLKDELQKLALHFQDIVKENRPKLDVGIEGIISGKVFYAYEGAEYGLIDGIKSYREVIAELTTITETRKKIISFI